MITRYQKGQALPLGLALALVGMLGALVLFNTGRLATDKARLANAADAAAYSGLLWQARALNFQAYTNRAMVANQVSIAQAVSLRSWSSYGARAAQNLSHVLSAVPPLSAYAQGASQVMSALDGFVGPVSEAMVGVIGAINTGVGYAQQAMYVSSFAATPEIVTAVARESDARFDAQTLYSVAGVTENLTQWSRLTSRYDNSDTEAMTARARLVNDSRDEFTRERKWRLFSNFWLYSTPLMRHKIMREGSTRLIMVEGDDGANWEWKAVDTVSLQNRIFRFGRSERRQEVPIGWGAAHANVRGGASVSERACASRWGRPEGAQCGHWTPNHVAEDLGRRLSHRMSGYRGLNAFRTLDADFEGLESGDPVVTLRTEVALDLSDVRSSRAFIEGELLETDVVAPGERLSSISAAELYYRRPDEGRGDELSGEGATGYNPYWTVRLAPVSMQQRMIATGLRGDVGSVAPQGIRLPSVSDESRGSSVGLADFDSGVLEAAASERLTGNSNIADGSLVSGLVEGRVPGALPSVTSEDAIGDALERAPERLVTQFQGRLPDYVGTLSEGYQSVMDDFDLASLELPGGDITDFAEIDIEAIVGDELSDIDLDNPGEYIEERLTDALETAVEDMLRGRVSDLEEQALGRVSEYVDLDVIQGAIDQGLEISAEFEAARQQVVAHMEAASPALIQMLEERMLSPDFDEDSPLRMFDGYDPVALSAIAQHFMTASAIASPEHLVPFRMAIEAAKSFYDDFRADIMERGAGASERRQVDLLLEQAGVAGVEGLSELQGLGSLEGIESIRSIEDLLALEGFAELVSDNEAAELVRLSEDDPDAALRDVNTERWTESDDGDEPWEDIFDVAEDFSYREERVVDEDDSGVNRDLPAESDPDPRDEGDEELEEEEEEGEEEEAGEEEDDASESGRPSSRRAELQPYSTTLTRAAGGSR